LSSFEEDDVGSSVDEDDGSSELLEDELELEDEDEPSFSSQEASTAIIISNARTSASNFFNLLYLLNLSML
jgi:hypothetical protein